MEKYLLLFRGGKHHNPTNPPEVMKAHVQKMMDWIGDLSKKGVYVGGSALERTGKQVTGTSKTVTDGPYIEAKEMIGGYVVVNAEDINQAVEFSKGCPNLEMEGVVEVRPFQKM